MKSGQEIFEFGYDTDEYCGEVYLDLSGKPVKRTPWSHPYSYDEFVIFKSERFGPMDCMVYSDRMLQWDREAFSKASHNGGNGFP